MTPKPIPFILALAAISTLSLSLSARHATAAETGGESPRPNILFAIADDASYPHMGAYGTTWVHTPGFDRVAREGLLFNRAYTPNAKCAPSRACILTGRNSWQLEAAANHQAFFPPEFVSYVEALGKAGYHTGYTKKGWAPGIAETADGKKRELTGKAYNKRTLNSPTTGIANTDYAGNFEDFLKDNKDRQPWCFWYGSVEPHRAYEYGSGIAKGGKKTSDIDKVPAFWPDTETTRTDMLDYAFEIEHFDSHLLRMIETLEANGQLDNTLIVVTADNGMPFPRVKGQEYEMSNHLPLAIMWKKGIQHPGRKIDDYVSFIDFAPTFLEVAHVAWEDTGMAALSGRSLTDIFESEKSGQVNPQRDHVLIGKERHDVGRPHDWGYPIRGIVKDGMLFLQNYEITRWPAGDPVTGYMNTDASPTKSLILDLRRKGENETYWQQSFGKRPAEEFYNIAEDRACLTNLANDEAYQKQKEALKKQLTDELTRQEDPRMFGQGNIFDEYPVAAPTAGYYERFMNGEKAKAGWIDPTDYETEPVE